MPKRIILVLLVAMAMLLVPAQAQAAAKLSKTSITLIKGESKKLKVKGGTAKR